MRLISKPQRIPSIDVFRALTMVCMIFVNDLWTVIGTPHWLEHAARGEDMLGFSDLVFPSFLFILGMSIPLAIGGRLSKGESKLSILKHIIIRSIALLAMGLFIVNTEAGVSQTMPISKSVFVLAMLIGFFLIWNIYPPTDSKQRKQLYSALKMTGVVILVVLAIMFRDASGATFQIHWWGILGLIGWTYLICATLYLFFHRSLAALVACLVVFVGICIMGANQWLGGAAGLLPGDGCFHAFTMSGVLLTLLFNQVREGFTLRHKIEVALAAGIVFLLAGFVSHSFWITSKLAATPTWLFLCTGISILFYLFIYWIVDINGKKGWFDLIKPAGTATLTCYLIPYLLYAIFYGLVTISLPDWLLTSPVGLIKSMAFAFICVGFTALLGKWGVKLKI